MLITLSRPELVDTRPAWGSGIRSYTALTLDPLSEEHAYELALRRLGDNERAADVVRVAGGNPLFIEQLAATIDETSSGTLPTSVRGIVAARLDALPRAERALLLDAAVIGKVFWYGALQAMNGNGRDLTQLLDELERRDLVRREPLSMMEGQQQYAFNHVLIRDVAYDLLPRADRARRHAMVAGYSKAPPGSRARRSVRSLGTGATQATTSAPSSSSSAQLNRRNEGGPRITPPSSTGRRSNSSRRRMPSSGARFAGGSPWRARPSSTCPTSGGREVPRRDIAGDLVDRVDIVLAQATRVLSHHGLARRPVDAEGAHLAGVVDDDMTVFPRDLRKLLLRDHPRAAPDRWHLRLGDVEASDDHVARHSRDTTVEMDEHSISFEELQLATRNHGMPLEALHEPVTPIGLHYLLVHYDIPHVDPSTWRLKIDGWDTNEVEFTLDELRALPPHEVVATMECAGNGRARLEPRPLSQPWLLEAVGTGRWRGVRLRDVLEGAGIAEGTVEVLFSGLDRGVENGEEQVFQRSLTLDEARRDDVLLAYELNGMPLPPQHGFPLRLLVPGWYGMTNVKWLSRVSMLAEPFTGYQQARGYRLRQSPEEDGEPLQRMLPRALMVPPGIPDFMTRDRTVERRPTMLEGRAWSGFAPVAAVEVSVDGGKRWEAARLDPPDLGPWAWRRWTYDWDPGTPGRRVLSVRARDEAGYEQPSGQLWNVGGYANNQVQQVVVTVI